MIGAVLAGGLGRRMGGGKPGRLLRGRPLAAYPAQALAQVCERVVIVAKAGEELPELPGVERWDEPASAPRHPLSGIVHALERAAPERVLVVAADMPFVTAEALRALAAQAGSAVAVAGGRLQPLLAVYAASDLEALKAAPPDAPLTRTVEALKPSLVEVPPTIARSIDSPAQLVAAEEEIGKGGEFSPPRT